MNYPSFYTLRVTVLGLLLVLAAATAYASDEEVTYKDDLVGCSTLDGLREFGEKMEKGVDSLEALNATKGCKFGTYFFTISKVKHGTMILKGIVYDVFEAKISAEVTTLVPGFEIAVPQKEDNTLYFGVRSKKVGV